MRGERRVELRCLESDMMRAHRQEKSDMFVESQKTGSRRRDKRVVEDSCENPHCNGGFVEGGSSVSLKSFM